MPHLYVAPVADDHIATAVVGNGDRTLTVGSIICTVDRKAGSIKSFLSYNGEFIDHSGVIKSDLCPLVPLTPWSAGSICAF